MIIRCILWKIGFELANLRKILFRDKRTVLLFSYGFFLDEAVLVSKKVKPLKSTLFVLENFALRFCHTSPYRGVGYSSLIPAANEKTYGKLYTLTMADLRRLDYHEKVPF